MRFGLMFFASSEAALHGDKYRMVLEGARFADAHGFSSVWVPERHFTEFGSLYPNPAVLHAALARETRHVRLQAGSVVAGLHHPLRVAEEWAMVDNLSGGRVGVSFASGWNPDDFSLAPDKYARRHGHLPEAIETVRRLWRGETLRLQNGSGEWVSVRAYPTPVQAELPVWVTAASNPETFRMAGRIGAHVLTHMLDQDAAALAGKIALYREARARHGHDPAAGQVAVMLHTFVGTDVQRVHDEARAPYCAYLAANLHLLQGLAASRGGGLNVHALSSEDREAFVGYLFERFFSTRALLGTPETCRPLLEQLGASGVDEIACLLDFGPPVDVVLEHLVHLERLKAACADVAREYRPVVESLSPGVPAAVGEPQPCDLHLLRERCPEELTGAEFYAQLACHGVELQGEFRGLEHVWCGEAEALGRLGPPGEAGELGFEIPPALVDAALQVLAAALPERVRVEGWQRLYVPSALGEWQVHAPVAGRLWSHARLTLPFSGGAAVVGDVRLLDEQGRLVAQASGLRLEPAPALAGLAEAPARPEWTYRCAWVPRPSAPPLSAGSLVGEHWVILCDAGGVGDALAARLRERGAQCVTLPAPRADDAARTAREALNGLLGRGHAPLRAVVHLWGLDHVGAAALTLPALQAAQALGVSSAMALAQVLAEHDPPGARLWLVTAAAQALEPETRVALAQTPLWGFGRACAMEHPELWGGLVDLDPRLPPETAAAHLLDALQGGGGEDQLAFRGAQCHVARVVREEWPQAPPPRLEPDAAYLITGGVSGVNRAVARWLLRRGARHLSILARTPLPPRAQWPRLNGAGRHAEALAPLLELERAGAQVEYAAVDVADERQLRAWLDARAAEGRPALRGVVHAASVWRDAEGQSLVRPLRHLDAAALEAVLRPKVQGAWVLAQALAGLELDFFLFFSSAAALFGSAGQANYAAASAYLDGLAHDMRASGRRALSINWGAVSELGFGASTEGRKVHEYWEARGFGRLAPDEVTAALDALLASPFAQVGVIKMDVERLRRFYPRLSEAPYFAQLAGVAREEAPASSWLARLRGAPLARRRELLGEHLRELIREAMGLPAAHPIEPRRGLFDMGMDSLMALDLKNRLQASLERSIPATLAFDYSTLETLSDYLERELWGASDAPDTSGEADQATASDAWGRISALPDSEVERLFAEKFSAQPGTKS